MSLWLVPKNAICEVYDKIKAGLTNQLFGETMSLQCGCPTRQWGIHRFTGHRSRWTTCRAVKARWSFDAKFGQKREALRLLQEWAKQMSLLSSSFPTSAVQISHGAIGVPESKLELELEFDSLVGLESFWESIPADYHRDWTSQMKDCIVDGTPQWTVQHVVPIEDENAVLDSALPEREVNADDGKAALEEMKEQAVLLGVDSPLDWKGDVMKINPGDKLPFKLQ